VVTSPDGATSETVYDSLGHVSSVSNFHTSTVSSTDGYVSYTYDPIGRPLYVCNQDNGTMPAPCKPGLSYKSFVYSGASETTKDEDGNQWVETTDALGRLKMVLEPNGTYKTASMETDYTYDALNNLLSVTQHGISGPSGARTRSFIYDSLSRLLTAANPETGAVTYSYITSTGTQCAGDSSLPCRKTDARGTTTSYGYDALNRLEPVINFVPLFALV
jgi:uncharacterized protein RhaS with RHS repeats